MLLQLKLPGPISVFIVVAQWSEGALSSQRTITSMEKQCRVQLRVLIVINVVSGTFEFMYISFQSSIEQTKDGYQN